MAWTQDLSVGVEILDQHHQRLFALLDEIENAESKASGLDTIKDVLAELIDYIAYHFKEEEVMMENANFPFLELHRHSHTTIAMRVTEMAFGLDDANFSATASELRLFLSGWLVHHIEIEDFEYRPYISGI